MKNRFSCLLAASVGTIILLLLVTVAPDLYLFVYSVVNGTPSYNDVLDLRESSFLAWFVLAGHVAQWLTWIAVPVFLVGSVFILRRKL
jgi:hypothetical protein